MLRFKRPGAILSALLLCLISVFGAAVPVSAAKRNVLCPAAAIRRSAHPQATIIGYLEQDTQVTVLEEYGDFLCIDCYDMVGYIPKNLVKYEDGEYYVNCKAGYPGTKVLPMQSLSQTLPLRRALYEQALALVGVPYVAGGYSDRGFDCSGFTSYVYAQLGISLSRTCDGQLSAGIIIPKEALQCGDLVLFQGTTDHPAIATHVGMYLGEGKLIHAGSAGIGVVELDSEYFTEHYLCARRIVLTQKLRPIPLRTATTANSLLRSYGK